MHLRVGTMCCGPPLISPPILPLWQDQTTKVSFDTLPLMNPFGIVLLPNPPKSTPPDYLDPDTNICPYTFSFSLLPFFSILILSSTYSLIKTHLNFAASCRVLPGPLDPTLFLLYNNFLVYRPLPSVCLTRLAYLIPPMAPREQVTP